MVVTLYNKSEQLPVSFRFLLALFLFGVVQQPLLPCYIGHYALISEGLFDASIFSAKSY